MSNQKIAPKIVCFGEVLWDLFPEGKKLGGAPFNVACTLHQLGAEVILISRIGKDELGNQLLNEIEIRGITTTFVQYDKNYATGTVEVKLDQSGSASYHITKNVAWDFIEALEEEITQVIHSDAFIFGSLIERGVSVKALDCCLEKANFIVFDVNLRPPHYNIRQLRKRMNSAHFIKFNEEELQEIGNALGSFSNQMKDQIKFISEETQTQHVCVTRGANGALFYTQGRWIDHSGYSVNVKDTVGAGDSFLATLIYGFLSGIDPKEALDLACAMGALVAQSEGANPIISSTELSAFIKSHKNL
ncbi:MAG: carbohydrate kinase [Flavobacteriaceae bacterium]